MARPRSTLTAALWELRSSYGRIDGVIHAAGVTDRSVFPTLPNADAAAVRRVTKAKVAGAAALAAALEPDEADFVLLCSSLSVVLGGVHFGAYVAANAALDSFAARRHLQGDRRWVSIVWDAWKLDATEGDRGSEGMARYALTADDGGEVFRRALAARGPVLWVSTGDIAARQAQVAAQVGSSEPLPESAAVVVSADPAAVVRAVVVDVLGSVPEDPDHDLRHDGLESLTILQLVTRLRAALGRPFPLAEAMRTLTLRTLTRLALGEQPATHPAWRESLHVVSVPAQEEYPTSSIQRRWLELLPEGYGGLDIAIEVVGAASLRDLADAVRAVVAKHSGLRTVFRRSGDTWLQRTIPSARVTEFDLSALAGETQREELVRRANELAEDPFDLDVRPPFAVDVIKLGPNQSVLLLHAYHVLLDGWSSSIVLRDIDSAMRGRLTAPGLQYVDYSTAQTTYLKGAEIAASREYWRRHFAGCHGPTRLPGTAVDDSADQGDVLRLSLEPEVTEALRARARASGATPFALMMTAFALLLHTATGDTDLVVGTTSAARPGPDTEDIVGVFVNPLPLRVRVQRTSQLRELLDRVQDSLVGFHENSAYPLEDLVRSVEPFVSGGLNDTFHCYLLYQNYWRPETEVLQFRTMPLPRIRHHKLMREFEIVIEERERALCIEVWFRPSRFVRADAQSWADVFVDTLRALAIDDTLWEGTVNELTTLTRLRDLSEEGIAH